MTVKNFKLGRMKMTSKAFLKLVERFLGMEQIEMKPF